MKKNAIRPAINKLISADHCRQKQTSYNEMEIYYSILYNFLHASWGYKNVGR